MKTHHNFLQFNETNIVFLNVDGTYWIALKPICEALGIDADRSIKTTKNDPFLGVCTSIQTVQIEKNGRIQGRKVVCLPEKYIYGWICFLRSESKELIEYKKTCYDLLYTHFHGTITNRKELLLEKTTIEKEIHEINEQLKEGSEQYVRLEQLQAKKKKINKELTSFDKELIKQPELFN